jgi:hypothetical protein
METVCASVVDQVEVGCQVPTLPSRKASRAVFRLLIRTQSIMRLAIFMSSSCHCSVQLRVKAGPDPAVTTFLR